MLNRDNLFGNSRFRQLQRANWTASSPNPASAMTGPGANASITKRLSDNSTANRKGSPTPDNPPPRMMISGWKRCTTCDNAKDGSAETSRKIRNAAGSPCSRAGPSCAVRVEPQVTNFRLTRRGSVINIAIDHQPTADAAAQGDIKHRVETSSPPVPRFAQRGRVGVVFHDRAVRA